jgi:hypothetical protein
LWCWLEHILYTSLAYPFHRPHSADWSTERQTDTGSLNDLSLQALQPNPMALHCYQRRAKVSDANDWGFVFCGGVTTEIASQLSNEGLASPTTSGDKLQGSITEKKLLSWSYFHSSPVSRVTLFPHHITETCWPERPFCMRLQHFRGRWTRSKQLLYCACLLSLLGGVGEYRTSIPPPINNSSCCIRSSIVTCNVLLQYCVTMDMKWTSRFLDTDIWRLSLMWEIPTEVLNAQMTKKFPAWMEPKIHCRHSILSWESWIEFTSSSYVSKIRFSIVTSSRRSHKGQSYDGFWWNVVHISSQLIIYYRSSPQSFVLTHPLSSSQNRWVCWLFPWSGILNN